MNKIENCIYEISKDNFSIGLVGAVHLPKKVDEESFIRQTWKRNGVRISSACLDRDGWLTMFSYATLSPLDFLDDSTKNKIRNQINTYEVGQR